MDADGGNPSDVSGRLEKNNQRIRFYPDEPWSTEKGVFYRYTMHSAATGDCAQNICGENGLALKTDLLVDPESVGGPDMEIYFRGAESTNTVFTPLRNLPIRDTNSNYVIDCVNSEGETDLSGTDCLEPATHEQPDGTFVPSANAAQLAVEKREEDEEPVQQKAEVLGIPVDAAVGCPAGEECPDSKFIYQTYGLNTEIIGMGTDEEGNKGVRVLLYPTILATTSASVFLDGLGEQATGPQILRMTYSEPTEDNPQGLVEGIIVEGDDGRPIFKTTANLTLDAPNLALPDGGTVLSHNLYSYPIPLTLQGPIDFFDDGRMQVVQRNTNAPKIIVAVDVEILIVGDLLDFLQDPLRTFEEIANEIDCFFNPNDCAELPTVETGNITIPLIIPANGVYLNFLSNPIKEIPEEY